MGRSVILRKPLIGPDSGVASSGGLSAGGAVGGACAAVWAGCVVGVGTPGCACCAPSSSSSVASSSGWKDEGIPTSCSSIAPGGASVVEGHSHPGDGAAPTGSGPATGEGGGSAVGVDDRNICS